MKLFGNPVGGKRDAAASLREQGDVAFRNGDLALAETLYRKSVKTDAGYMAAHYSLGLVLRASGRPADALACFDAAARLAPNDPEIHLNRGVTLTALARYAHAVNAFEFTHKLAPHALEPPLNKGAALARAGKFKEAIDIWSDMLAKHPGLSVARYYRSMTYLLLGRMEEGFLEHESRLDLPNVVPHDLLAGKQKWDGGRLDGKTLLIYPEQGMGDMIQFLRYAPACKALGARTMVVCHAPLVRLLEGVEGIDVVVPDDGTPLPGDFDAYIALMSLPHVLGVKNMPEPLRLRVPVEPHLEIARASGLKVGVCWRGNRKHDRDAERSIAAAMFWKSLKNTGNVSFFSLQVDEEPDPCAISLAPSIRDFRDTASLVQQLDVVVTVDTSVAHLSASLGVPTWVLVTYSPDWRWGLEGTSTPWYPSVRIFRQPEPGDWAAALKDVKAALQLIT